MTDNIDELAQLLEGMSPEDAQAYFGLGSLDDRDALLQQQMGLAQQLRQPGQERSSVWGSVFGGLGDAIGNIGGAAMQKGLMDKRTGIRDQQDKGRSMMADILREYAQKRRADAMAGLTAPGGGVIAPIPGGM